MISAIIMSLWVIGFLVSTGCFIKYLIDYRKAKISVKPIIVSGIISLVLAVPIVFGLMLVIGLSTGLIGM